MNLKNAITDKLQFSIQNKTDRSIRVALATGNIDVEGFDTSNHEDPETGALVVAVSHHFHNIDALVAEGYSVDTVLDDAVVSLLGSPRERIAMASVDSSKTIRHAKRSLRRNFRWIKKITIAANSTAAYQTSMSIATLSPFHKENERDIDLNDYFSVQQYQNDKIVIPLAHGELQWNDDFFWALNIPVGVTEQITVEFYD